MGQTLGSYCIWVTDMDRAVDFWETLMGLDVQLHTDLGTIKEVVLASNDGGSRLQLAHDGRRRVHQGLRRLHHRAGTARPRVGARVSW